jgi:fumarylacetoacetate (FAA) hydrolase family protein
MNSVVVIADSGAEMARLTSEVQTVRGLTLVRHASGPHHAYPDGFVLFCGTMFAPIQDRDTPGMGFTHKYGDRVSIQSEHLGALINDVAPTHSLPRWEFGIRALFDYIHRHDQRR